MLMHDKEYVDMASAAYLDSASNWKGPPGTALDAAAWREGYDRAMRAHMDRFGHLPDSTDDVKSDKREPGEPYGDEGVYPVDLTPKHVELIGKILGSCVETSFWYCGYSSPAKEIASYLRIAANVLDGAE